jgi:hypothetical protein
VPKNVYFWHLSLFNPGKILIFMKRNDGTIAKTYRLTGKAGKGALHNISAGRVDSNLLYKKIKSSFVH